MNTAWVGFNTIRKNDRKVSAKKNQLRRWNIYGAIADLFDVLLFILLFFLFDNDRDLLVMIVTDCLISTWVHFVSGQANW